MLFNAEADVLKCSCVMQEGYRYYITILDKEREMIRKIIVVALLIMSIWTLTGCNTVHGIGKDIESGGRAIERSSGK